MDKGTKQAIDDLEAKAYDGLTSKKGQEDMELDIQVIMDTITGLEQERDLLAKELETLRGAGKRLNGVILKLKEERDQLRVVIDGNISEMQRAQSAELKMKVERDQARMEHQMVKGQYDLMWMQRDEARAEVERLQGELPPKDEWNQWTQLKRRALEAEKLLAELVASIEAYGVSGKGQVPLLEKARAHLSKRGE